MPLVAGSVAPGSVAAGSVAAGSVAAGSVAAGGCVAGGAPPQAARIILVSTSRLNNVNSLRILFFSSQNLKVCQNILNRIETSMNSWNNHLLSKEPTIRTVPQKNRRQNDPV